MVATLAVDHDACISSMADCNTIVHVRKAYRISYVKDDFAIWSSRTADHDMICWCRPSNNRSCSNNTTVANTYTWSSTFYQPCIIPFALSYAQDDHVGSDVAVLSNGYRSSKTWALPTIAFAPIDWIYDTENSDIGTDQGIGADVHWKIRIVDNGATMIDEAAWVDVQFIAVVDVDVALDLWCR